MRILLITDRLPYPVVSGAPLRIYSLLQRIAKRHEIWLATMAGEGNGDTAVAHLKEFCAGLHVVDTVSGGALGRPAMLLAYLLSGKPPELRLYWSDALARGIRAWASAVSFDIVQIEHGHMGLYLDALPGALSAKAFWTLHDVDSIKHNRIARLEPKPARRLRMWLHGRAMQRWEPRFAERFARCVTVSEKDRQLLHDANPRLRIEVIPNGVDTAVYRPLPPAFDPALLFVGNMDYRPNVDAMQYFHRLLWPGIRQQIPGAQLWIVGTHPQPEIQRLADDHVHVTGEVNDVRPYYERSAVCVIPLRAGGGTRLKILEAMALGRPVVSTSIGCEGLEVVSGEHLFIADNPEEFVAKTVLLLRDEAVRRRMVERARALVVQRYDWDHIADRLMANYAAVAQAQRAVP